MHALWRRIEGVLDERARRSEAARERRGSLRPPASAAEVAAAEAEIGLPLAEDLRASLAVHDGQDRGALEVFVRWGLLPLAAGLELWRLFEAMAREGTLAGWRRAWLPIASDGGGDYLLLDLQSGAVVRYRRASSSRPIVAASLRAWLAETVDSLPPEDDEA